VGKKLLGVVSILLLMLLLIFNASKNNNNTYDNEFLTSLAKGLDKRWEFVAKREYDKESLKNYRICVDYELNELKKYNVELLDKQRIVAISKADLAYVYTEAVFKGINEYNKNYIYLLNNVNEKNQILKILILKKFEYIIKIPLVYLTT